MENYQSMQQLLLVLHSLQWVKILAGTLKVIFYRKRINSICGRNFKNLVIINFSFSEMSFRTFGHLLRYGEPAVRRAVPLAIALTSISNPQLHIVDTLSKFSHDSDGEVAFNCKLFLWF